MKNSPCITSPATTKTGFINLGRSTFRLLAIAAVALLGLSAASDAFAACTGGSTLTGRYSLQVYGATKASVGKFLTGTLTFDGACGAKGLVSIGENGGVNTYVNATGSYIMNSDSTFTITLVLPGVASPETYDIGFSPVLGEAVGIETDGSAIATMDLKPQVFPASNPAVTYTNASLKGTWASSCIAPGSRLADLSYLTFDGSTSNYGVFGNMTGVDHNYANSFALLSVTSMYGVLADGSFGGSITVNGQYPFGFTGSLGNNGNELQYVIIQGSGVLESCTAKRVK